MRGYYSCCIFVSHSDFSVSGHDHSHGHGHGHGHGHSSAPVPDVASGKSASMDR